MARPLCIFDSGIGGLTLLSYLLPSGLADSYLYLADQANFPYGDKTPAWLQSRLKKIASWFQLQDPLAVVLACNTATVHALADVRAKLSPLHVFGIEPLTKPLSAYHQSLLLVTPATFQTLSHKELPHGMSFRPMPNLAQAIEKMDGAQVETIIGQLALDPNLKHVEAIGLSCTHYPLVQSTFQSAFPRAEILDPAQAVFRHMQNTLSPPAAYSASPAQFYTTGSVLRLKQQVEHYLGIEVEPKKLTL